MASGTSGSSVPSAPAFTIKVGDVFADKDEARKQVQAVSNTVLPRGMSQIKASGGPQGYAYFACTRADSKPPCRFRVAFKLQDDGTL